jgi:hypothetical protein
MGFLLGVGVTLLLPALGRSDLDLKGLAGVDGIWLAAGLLAVLILVGAVAPGKGDDRAARWLDLGLPAALGVLAVGLGLGLAITDVHEGLFGLLREHVAAWLPSRFARYFVRGSPVPLILFVHALPVVLCSFFIQRPLRFGLGVAALLLASSFCDLLDGDVRLRARSFFGVLHVTDGGNYRKLEHGTTLHGMQRVRWGPVTLVAGAACPLAAADPLGGAALLAAWRDTLAHPGRAPLTYFHRDSPVGQVFAAYQEHFAGRHLGLIGLGTGTLASYGQPGQRLTYYEIDPLVKRVAYDPACFTYLRDADDRGVCLEVVLGDARLKLEERARPLTLPSPPAAGGEGRVRGDPPEKFALLVVDAFSSDAIPVHLITREALRIYLDNLADDGLLAFHISNRYLDLEPVLANLAQDLGLAGVIQQDEDDERAGKAASSWVVLARREHDLDRLVHEGRWPQWQEEQGWDEAGAALVAVASCPGQLGRAAPWLTLLERLKPPWRYLKGRPEVGVWTDDYSNLLRVFMRGR